MRVYFDYNATTPLSPDAADAVMRTTRDVFGNASSVHHFGQQAKATMDDARSAGAAPVNSEPPQIVFTSGGTQSDQLAHRGPPPPLEPTGPPPPVASAVQHQTGPDTLKAPAG